MIVLHLLQHEPGVRLGLADFLNCGIQGLNVRLDVAPRADHLADHGAQLGVLLFEIGDALGRISGEKVSCHTLTLPPAAVMASRNRACRSEEHTSELQSRPHLVCRLLLEKKYNEESAEALL